MSTFGLCYQASQAEN